MYKQQIRGELLAGCLMIRRTAIAAIIGLTILTSCTTGLTRGRILHEPMVALTTRELSSAQGHPPRGRCRALTVTHYGDCVAPLDALRVRLPNGPQGGMFITLPAVTTETRDHKVRLKAAVGNPAINDQVMQSVLAQLVVRGRAVIGAQMHATWHYRGGLRQCTGATGSYGVATCSEMPLGFASRDGEPVVVTVSFEYGNRLYSSHVTYQAFMD